MRLEMLEEDGHEHLQQKYIRGRTVSADEGPLRRELLALLAGRP